jgi:hypothetical protein
MAARRPKQIGTDAETRVGRYLARWWPGIHRTALAGAGDVGDLVGVPHLCIQVKGGKGMALAGWVDATAKQAANAGVPHFVVVHKRIGKGDPAEWYATLPLGVFANIYREASR